MSRGHAYGKQPATTPASARHTAHGTPHTATHHDWRVAARRHERAHRVAPRGCQASDSCLRQRVTRTKPMPPAAIAAPTPATPATSVPVVRVVIAGRGAGL